MSNGHDKPKACVPGQKVGNAVQNCPPKTGSIWVYVKDSQGKGVRDVSVSSPGAATTDASGLAVFDSLAVKNYVVTVSKLPDQAAQNYYLLDADRTRRAVGVTAGSINKVVFQLKPKPSPNISVDAPKIVLVKRAYQGKDKPGVKPHRIPVKLGVDADYDGHGELTVSHDDVKLFEKLDDKTDKALPYSVRAADLKVGKTVWLEGKAPSAAVESTELKLTLKGGAIPPKKVDATEKITCIKLTLDVFKTRPDGGGDPPKMDEGPKIDPGRPVLIQQKHGGQYFSERAKLVVHRAEPAKFSGNLVLSAITDSVELFRPAEEKPAAGQKAFPNHKRELINTTIDAGNGNTYWTEGKTRSANIGDTGWKLGVVGVDDAEGDRVTMTVLEADLALFQSRSIPKSEGEPTAFTSDDKYDKGRYIHKQHRQFHGRARVLVKRVQPDGFAGTLVLTAWHVKHTGGYIEAKAAGPRISVFEQEEPKAGQTSKAFPIEIAYPAAVPKDGKEFWIEGSDISGELRDTEIRLGVKDYDKGSDRVVFTVVRFKNLQADVPSTPAIRVRNMQDGGPPSNSPVPRHAFVAGSNNPDKHFSDDFSINEPLPLIERSVLHADPVKLSVEIEPSGLGIAVSWFPIRAFDDAKKVKDLAGNSEDPGLRRDPANVLKATLETGAAGSFRIRAYIDCNGDNRFNERTDKGARLDREPFICMNLVLIRVKGVNNTSRGNSAAAVAGADANGITWAAGVPTRFDTGDFAGTGNDASNMKAKAHVVAGGPNGKRGLEYLFTGWCNTITDFAASPTPNHWGLDITHHHQPPPPGALTGLRSFFALDGVIIQGPILDAGIAFGAAGGTGGGSCTGTMSGHEPAPAKVDDLSGIGQRWSVKNFDSPGFPIITTHPADATAVLVRFRFNVDFRCDLVFWTNFSKVFGPSAHAANRLYVAVQSNTWTVRMESTFAAGFVETQVTRRTVVFNKDADPTRLATAVADATPIDGLRLETRGPEDMPLLKAAKPFDPAHPELP